LEQSILFIHIDAYKPAYSLSGAVRDPFHLGFYPYLVDLPASAEYAFEPDYSDAEYDTYSYVAEGEEGHP
jgi:hypothetical protein